LSLYQPPGSAGDCSADGPKVLETIRQIKRLAVPPPKTTLGLSNVSQGCGERRLLNRTFLVLATATGLNSAIVDVEDEMLTDAVAAAEVLLNKNIYCDAFLRIYRQR
jgi:5-methyltetrahydrofolate corrinoid/iron sulfur protein methyltransferase